MPRLNSIEALEQRQLFAADLGFSMASLHVDSTAQVSTFEVSTPSLDDIDAAFAGDLDGTESEEKKEEGEKTTKTTVNRAKMADKAYNKMMSYMMA